MHDFIKLNLTLTLLLWIFDLFFFYLLFNNVNRKGVFSAGTL